MPGFRDNELRNLILDGKVDEFNARAAEAPPDLENTSLRGADLQRFDLSHADLRGCDLFWADLEGASLHGARISGARFPRNLDAGEIRMSVDLGTRMRTAVGAKP